MSKNGLIGLLVCSTSYKLLFVLENGREIEFHEIRRVFGTLDRWSKLFLHEFFRPTYLTWLLSGQEIKFFDLAKNDLKNFQSPVSILWNSIFRSWDFDLGSVPSEPIHYRRELRRRHYGSKLPIDNQCGQRRCC
jgi:hypothetical protein